MPEPNRPPFRIAPQLQGLRMWQIMEAPYQIAIACDACPNFKVWKPDELKRTFARLRNKRIDDVAAKLRCRKCRSNWLRIGVAG